MESNAPIVTSTLTRKYSQNSPKKEALSPTQYAQMNEKSYSHDGPTSTIPAGFCTTPRLKKAHSLKLFGNVEGSMPRLGHILRELYNTEIDYVNSLEKTVHIYMKGLLKANIPDVKMICYKIFGNIQDILHFHQDVFLPRLEETYHSAGEVSALLLEHYEDFMKLYIKYCLMVCESNQLLKSKAIKPIFKSIREEHKDKQSLSNYLIRPVQRITQYELMLNQMISTYQKANIPCWNIEKASAVIKEVPTLADNAMRLNSILKYKEHFNVKHLRLLRLHNMFIVSDRDKRFSHKKFYVYLMVDRIIFTKICCDNSGTELLCTFKSELFLEEDCVSIKYESVPEKDPRIFVLQKGKKEIYMQAEKVEIKDKWVNQIRELVTPMSPPLLYPEVVSTIVTPVGTSPPPYDEYWKTNSEHQSSNTDEEYNEDIDSDLVDLKRYVVIEDFDPDETNQTMNGFIGLRRGQIYEVRYKELSHWNVTMIGHVNPSSSENWSGLGGFAYPQFLAVHSQEVEQAPETNPAPLAEQIPEIIIESSQSLDASHEQVIFRKQDVTDSLIESDHIYTPPKRVHKNGGSKFYSSLTRKLAKSSRTQSDRQSIAEEDPPSDYESARSSISYADSTSTDRDTFFSVTSDSESDNVQRPDSPEIGDFLDDQYSRILSLNTFTDRQSESDMSITPVIPPLSFPDDRTTYRDPFGQFGEQVLLKYGSREELNADMPPDGREENPILDDLKTFGNKKLSPHHKADSIPANLDRIERDCEGSSRKDDESKTSQSDKLMSRTYTPLKRSSSDQSKKIFRTQTAQIKTEIKPIETPTDNDSSPISPDERPIDGSQRKRSNSVHKIIERFNSCSTDTSFVKSPKRPGNFKRHSLLVATESVGLDGEMEDKYKTITPSQGKRSHNTLTRALSFDKDSINPCDFVTDMPSPERPGSTDTLKNTLLFDVKSPQEETIENSVFTTETKSVTSNDTHTLKIATNNGKTRTVSPEPYKLPIKITTKKVVSPSIPPMKKPKPKVNVKSYEPTTIMGNFEVSNFNEIFKDIPREIKKKTGPPPIRPKNKNLIDEYKIPVISKPLKDMIIVSGRLADICFEIETEIENLQVDWYKDSIVVSQRRYHTSINGRVCALKIWDFGEFDQATYEAVVKSRGGHANTKCKVGLSTD